MKQIIFIACLFSLCLLCSCESQGPSGTPEDAIKGFLEKVKANDFSGAKEFTSNNTDATMDFMKTRIEMLKEMGKTDEIPALFGGIDITQPVKVTCKTTENKATCDCCEEVTGNCNSISVIQEGGKWLIDQPKEATVKQ